ncbi:hypothetical protein [Candidatus Symbiopectobacterium sp. 'North America']|uniref:hypothetical protein n=1 Tax=Candidatus Symbiopectobacterium sp. 'North America' TaxID=2794574 RepID=UPI0018C9B0A9|nr:hypothetical protein [Candidatus Symbiopectobacterium sp. 'North America']
MDKNKVIKEIAQHVSFSVITGLMALITTMQIIVNAILNAPINIILIPLIVFLIFITGVNSFFATKKILSLFTEKTV